MSQNISTRELGRRVGITEAGLRQAERRGRIKREPDGTWNVDRVRRDLGERTCRPDVRHDIGGNEHAAWQTSGPNTESRSISVRELARTIGTSHTLLQKAERNGRIKREPDGTWNIDRVRQGLAVKLPPSGGRPRKAAATPPWATTPRQVAPPATKIIGPARAIYDELEQARHALSRAAQLVARHYPDILRLDAARDAAIAAQERPEA